VQGEKIAERPIAVRRFTSIAQITDCHILFHQRIRGRAIGQNHPGLPERSLLTVSDAKNFSREGGIVRFVTENGKIRMRINVEAGAPAASRSAQKSCGRPRL